MIEQAALELFKEKVIEAGEKILEEKALDQVATKEKLGAINKEFNDEFLQKTADGVYKKEVGDKLDKKLVPDYLREVEKITNRDIKPIQMEKFNEVLKQQDFEKMSSQENEVRRKLFNNCREKLIEEWEKNTGDEWPRYEKDILNERGEVLRSKGQPYDAHHLIEASFGGPNEWWNLHPAAYPDEHQKGIHGNEKTLRLYGRG